MNVRGLAQDIHRSGHVEVRRVGRALAGVLLVVAATAVAAAQPGALPGGPSLASVVTEADAAARAASRLGATLSGDAQVAAVQMAAALAVTSQRVRAAAPGNGRTPVSALADKVRPDALRLAAVAHAVNALLGHPGACLFQDLDVVIGALKTATATLKAPLPSGEADAPQLQEFRFDGHSTAGLVPRDGGAVVLTGSKLWVEPPLPPEVKLVSDSGAIALTPQRGADADEIKLALGKDVVTQNAGKCATLAITPFATSHMLLMSRGPKKLAELSLPLCFPAPLDRSFTLTASLTTGTTTTSATSGPVPVAAAATRLCANVARDASPATRTFSLSIAPAAGAAKPMAPVYAGAPKPAADMSIFSFEETAGPYLVHVTYNPTLMGMSQICADISMPQACSW